MGVFELSKTSKADSVRILGYHGVWRAPDAFAGDSMFIRPEVFGARLDMIRKGGYRVISLDDAVEAMEAGDSATLKNAVVITIDDGWLGTYRHMAPELEKRGMPATLYCDTAHLTSGLPIAHVMAYYLNMLYGGDCKSDEARATYAAATDLTQPLEERWRACQAYAQVIGVDLTHYRGGGTFEYMTPEQLRDFADRGFDVQLHTHTHTLRDFSRETVVREISDNRAALSEILGRPEETFAHFCYPSGEWSRDAFASFKELNIASAVTCDMSLATAEDDALCLPRLLDNGACAHVEFLAELAGVGDRLRASRRALTSSSARPTHHAP